MPRSLPLALVIVAASYAGTALAQLKPPTGAAATGMTSPAAAPTPAPAAAGPAPVSKEDAAKINAGQLAAAGWLSLLDRRDWGTAWEASSAVFRSTVPLAAWMDGIPKARGVTGNLVERTPLEANYKTTLQGRPDGDYVSVIFASRFDQRELQEIITTVREPDGRWRVAGYSTR